jgi:hypothetical protein
VSHEPAAPMTATRPFARSGFLIAMLAGATIGTIAARALESSIHGADPEFVSVLGAAFGGILGRSIWTRVHRSRQPGGIPLASAMLILLARIAVCALVGAALIGDGGPLASIGAMVRMAIVVLGVASLVGLGALEYRLAARTAHGVPTRIHGTDVD